jgi:hypothetical protein
MHLKLYDAETSATDTTTFSTRYPRLGLAGQ